MGIGDSLDVRSNGRHDMRLQSATILSHEEVAPSTYLMWLSCPPVARGASPGRFLMIRCSDGFDPLLPRPMSFHRFRQDGPDRQFAILYDVRRRATTWLSKRKSGEQISIFGPLGRPCPVKPGAQNLLLVAGGMGIAALVAFIDEAVAAGQAVTLLYGARTASRLYPLDMLPREVEVALSTDDGTLGHHGRVTDLMAGHMAWADHIVLCGPTPMLATAAEVVRGSESRRPAQGLLESPMACGTGVCYGCAIKTTKGMRLTCKDGPRFELREVVF